MTPEERTRLEIDGAGNVTLVRGTRRIPLARMTVTARVVRMWKHLGTHGPEAAETFLAGFIDGLIYAQEMHAKALLERIEALQAQDPKPH